MADQVIDYYAQKALYETEAQGILRAQKMYDYLKNDSASIRYHLRQYLGKIFNAKTLTNMPLIWINEVPRIIRRLCLVYKKPPKRDLGSDGANKKYADVTKYLNKYCKEIHKQGKLFNTVLVRPIWNELKKQLDYQIIMRNVADVTMKQDNPLEMEELRYQMDWSPDDNPNTVETIIIHWTADENWATDANGNEKTLPNMPEDKKNPYGRIPFEILRFEECADFWGDGMPDLVEGQEALNARLTDMFYKLYMSFGQPIGTNLGIKVEDYSIGVDKPILRDNVRNDSSEAMPDLKFATPEHKTDFDKQVNDWFQDILANTKGLPSNGITYSSGYEREVDNIELLDINQDDQEILRDFEDRRFELEKIILKVDAHIDITNTKYEVTYSKIEFPQTETDRWTRREFEYGYNISTPLDWLQEDHPTSTPEDIKKLLQDNRSIKIELGQAQPTLFEMATSKIAKPTPFAKSSSMPQNTQVTNEGQK